MTRWNELIFELEAKLPGKIRIVDLRAYMKTLPGGELEIQKFLRRMPHPVTGRSLRPAVVRWKADSNQENSHEDFR